MTRSQLLLFTGAGFSLGATDRTGQRLPSIKDLQKELWALSFPGQPQEPDATLGELYEVALQRNKPALQRLLEVRLSVDSGTLPEYYWTYFKIPWHRVYTLNMDDLEAAVARRFSLSRQLVSVSATQVPKEEIKRPGIHTLEVIHLNGVVGDPPESLTFSETQYAVRIANQEPWYARCAADLRARPAVFVGTELREGTLWQHIELRRRNKPSDSTIPPPGSILVTPKISTARAEMLQSLNIDWYQGTAESFARDVLDLISDEAQKGFVFLRSYDEGFGRSGIPLVSDLAGERPSLSTEYLLGGEPHWSDLINGRAAARASNQALLAASREVLEGKRAKTAVALTGTAGTGKSTALMWLALDLSNRGFPVLWIDKDSTAGPFQIRKRLDELEGKVVLAIDDADLFGAQFASMLRDLVPGRSDLLVLFAVRSGKADDLLGPILRGKELSVLEHVVPNLTDDDIDKLIEVLDHHNRLGILKGASPEARRAAFAERAGRQLLVAMIEATSGQRFEEKAESELDELDGTQKFVYAVISVVSSQRHFLTKDEILLATASLCDDAVDALNRLVKRHLVVASPPYYQYRARHRVIADLVLDRLQREGQLKPILSGIVVAAASKVDPFENRRSRSWKLLARFINHELLLTLVGLNDARHIYMTVENFLASEYHYWLQRGSMEVEAGDVRFAEHFLNQARSLNTQDHRIDTEYGYMLMRKAIETPDDPRAQGWIDSATQMLEALIASRGDADYHPFHVLGSQGLAWSRRAPCGRMEKRRLLSCYVNVVEDGLKKHPLHRDLSQLRSDLQREILMTAVDP